MKELFGYEFHCTFKETKPFFLCFLGQCQFFILVYILMAKSQETQPYITNAIR